MKDFERILLTDEEYNNMADEKKAAADKMGYHKSLNTFVMKHTLSTIERDEQLLKSLELSKKNTKVIYENDRLEADFNLSGTTNILMTNKTSFEAAKSYAGKNVAVLDFASCVRPGGGPFTAFAQEECLCRVSTLYPCLEQEYHSYYALHNEYLSYFGTSDMIYVPGVMVFKTDESAPKMMAKQDRFEANVIVASAPKLKGKHDYERDDLEKVLTERLERIFKIAQLNKNEVLILGAFGNGDFENPPEITAKVFKSLLAKYHFETVEFAIPARKSMVNYDKYKSILFDK